jgi:hypothetical protein
MEGIKQYHLGLYKDIYHGGREQGSYASNINVKIIKSIEVIFKIIITLSGKQPHLIKVMKFYISLIYTKYLNFCFSPKSIVLTIFK